MKASYGIYYFVRHAVQNTLNEKNVTLR